MNIRAKRRISFQLQLSRFVNKTNIIYILISIAIMDIDYQLIQKNPSFEQPSYISGPLGEKKLLKFKQIMKNVLDQIVLSFIGCDEVAEFSQYYKVQETSKVFIQFNRYENFASFTQDLKQNKKYFIITRYQGFEDIKEYLKNKKYFFILEIFVLVAPLQKKAIKQIRALINSFKDKKEQFVKEQQKMRQGLIKLEQQMIDYSNNDASQKKNEDIQENQELMKLRESIESLIDSNITFSSIPHHQILQIDSLLDFQKISKLKKRKLKGLIYQLGGYWSQYYTSSFIDLEKSGEINRYFLKMVEIERDMFSTQNRQEQLELYENFLFYFIEFFSQSSSQTVSFKQSKTGLDQLSSVFENKEASDKQKIKIVVKKYTEAGYFYISVNRFIKFFYNEESACSLIQYPISLLIIVINSLFRGQIPKKIQEMKENKTQYIVLFRGFQETNEDQILLSKVGNIVYYKGFMSTSCDEKQAEVFGNCLLAIIVPLSQIQIFADPSHSTNFLEGFAWIEVESQYKNEKQVLFNVFNSFKVVDRLGFKKSQLQLLRNARYILKYVNPGIQKNKKQYLLTGKDRQLAQFNKSLNLKRYLLSFQHDFLFEKKNYPQAQIKLIEMLHFILQSKISFDLNHYTEKLFLYFQAFMDGHARNQREPDQNFYKMQLDKYFQIVQSHRNIQSMQPIFLHQLISISKKLYMINLDKNNIFQMLLYTSLYFIFTKKLSIGNFSLTAFHLLDQCFSIMRCQQMRLAVLTKAYLCFPQSNKKNNIQFCDILLKIIKVQNQLGSGIDSKIVWEHQKCVKSIKVHKTQNQFEKIKLIEPRQRQSKYQQFFSSFQLRQRHQYIYHRFRNLYFEKQWVKIKDVHYLQQKNMEDLFYLENGKRILQIFKNTLLKRYNKCRQSKYKTKEQLNNKAIKQDKNQKCLQLITKLIEFNGKQQFLQHLPQKVIEGLYNFAILKVKSLSRKQEGHKTEEEDIEQRDKTENNPNQIEQKNILLLCLKCSPEKVDFIKLFIYSDRFQRKTYNMHTIQSSKADYMEYLQVAKRIIERNNQKQNYFYSDWLQFCQSLTKIFGGLTNIKKECEQKRNGQKKNLIKPIKKEQIKPIKEICDMVILKMEKMNFASKQYFFFRCQLLQADISLKISLSSYFGQASEKDEREKQIIVSHIQVIHQILLLMKRKKRRMKPSQCFKYINDIIEFINWAKYAWGIQYSKKLAHLQEGFKNFCYIELPTLKNVETLKIQETLTSFLNVQNDQEYYQFLNQRINTTVLTKEFMDEQLIIYRLLQQKFLCDKLFKKGDQQSQKAKINISLFYLRLVERLCYLYQLTSQSKQNMQQFASESISILNHIQDNIFKPVLIQRFLSIIKLLDLKIVDNQRYLQEKCDVRLYTGMLFLQKYDEKVFILPYQLKWMLKQTPQKEYMQLLISLNKIMKDQRNQKYIYQILESVSQKLRSRSFKFDQILRWFQSNQKQDIHQSKYLTCLFGFIFSNFLIDTDEMAMKQEEKNVKWIILSLWKNYKKDRTESIQNFLKTINYMARKLYEKGRSRAKNIYKVIKILKKQNNQFLAVFNPAIKGLQRKMKQTIQIKQNKEKNLSRQILERCIEKISL